MSLFVALFQWGSGPTGRDISHRPKGLEEEGMRGSTFWKSILVGFVVLSMAGLALGQAQSGNIYGKCVAEDGSVLPGVTVTLTGGGAPQTFTTDSRGEFRFLNLAPSDQYSVKLELPGFSTV